MNRLVLIAACAVLALPAAAATISEESGVNSALGIAPATKDFVQEAAISDMFEIESGKLALTKLSGPDASFADQMITDHTRLSSELSGEANAANVPVPSVMDDSHNKMLARLKGLNGEDFRKQYLSDQVSGHKEAVSLFTRYGKGGDNPKLKDWASATLPTLQHHLDMAQGLYRNS